MIKYADLPPYANLNLLSQAERQKWMEKINFLKRKIIIPIIERGKPKFQSKYDLEYNKVKTMINDDFSSLVRIFLLCLRELKNYHPEKKGIKQHRVLVSIFFGQQEYEEDDELKELKDGFDYGHLRHLEKIYFGWHYNNDTFYLEMMKTLCSPYVDVMKNTIYMCKELFKESEDIDLNLLSKKETDYLID